MLPLDRVGCYVPGGRYPAALFAADDGDSGARCRRARSHRRLPEARPDGHVRRARGRRLAVCSESAARTRSRRWPTARRTVPRVDRIVGPGNAYVAAAKALVVARLRDRLLCRTERDCDPLDDPGKPAWIAADLIAQAEHDPDARAILITPSTAARRRGRARGRAPAAAAGPARAGSGVTRRHHRHAHRSTRPSPCASGWRPSTPCATATPSPRG